MSALTTPIELFYSYADADEDLRIELDKHLSQLQRDGLIATFHKRQTAAGTDWAKSQDSHLNTASIILLLISSDFLASDYCMGYEMHRAMERYEAGDVRVIPILLRPCDRQSAPFGKLQALPSDGRPVTSWPNLDEAFADIVQGIRTALEGIKPPAVNAPPTMFPRIWNVPYPCNPVFTGREEILSRIHAQLRAGQTTALSQPQAISGLGGIGKTQIAVEYAYQHRQDYQTILWILADTRESLTSGYITVAELLNLPQKDEQDQITIIRAVVHWLTTHTEWLLILDNADDLSVVREFVPSVFGGHILLTTRAQAMGRLASRIEVDSMPQDIGALFLLHRASLIASDALLEAASPSEVALAKAICEELGGLPLALDQAGAYLEEMQCGLSDYQQLYRTRRGVLLKRRGGLVADHPESVATTWSLAIEKVEQANPVAADLLRVCAFLQPEFIPEEIIQEGAQWLGPQLQSLLRDPLVYNEAARVLLSYSLIQRNPNARLLSMHRLVQTVLRDDMDVEIYRQWVERVVQAVDAVLPEVDHSAQERYQRCIAHALGCVQFINELQLTSPAVRRLLYVLGVYLSEHARYGEAEPLLQYALRIQERMLGSAHPDIVTTLSSLANLYQRQARYVEAEPLYTRALHVREQAFGSDHPQLASPLNNLANLYQQQGKHSEAETLYIRALQIIEQAFGSEHLNLAAPLTNLANLYALQGKYTEAESFYRQALHIRGQVLSPEHPELAYPLYDLANLYLQQNQHAKAELLYQQALHIWEHALGPEHPEVAYPLHGLAILYLQQKRSVEAEPLYQRALQIREQVLGPTHDLTRTTAQSYAALLHMQRRTAEVHALETRFSFLLIRPVDPEERETIEEYLFLDEDLLYSLIPPYVVENAIYSFPGQIEDGKECFQALEPVLRKKLCEEWELCKKLNDPTSTDQVNLVLAIGDAIAHQVRGIPSTLIAAILVKKGLRTFCRCSP